MQRLIAVVIAAFFSLSGTAFAASHAGPKMDDKKDGMAKDGMKKDGMAMDGKKKGKKKKPAMKKEEMKK